MAKAGLVKWYNNSFPNCGREFDSRIPHSYMKQKTALSVLVVIVLAVCAYLVWNGIQTRSTVKKMPAEVPVISASSTPISVPTPSAGLDRTYAFLFDSQKDPYHGNIVGYFAHGAFSIYIPQWMYQNWDIHIPDVGETTTISPKTGRIGSDFSDITMRLSTSTELYNAESLYESDLKERSLNSTLVNNEVLLSRPGQGGTTINTEDNTRIYHETWTLGDRTYDYYYLNGKNLTLEIDFNVKTEFYAEFADHIRDFVEGIGEIRPYQG